MSHNWGDGRPWVGAAAAERPPMPPRHTASVPLPPRGLQGLQPPRHTESMRPESHLHVVMAGVCQVSCRLKLVAGPENLPPPLPPCWDFGVEAMQGMTNVMNTMETAWVRLDALFKDESAFIKDLMQVIRSVSANKDREDKCLMDYSVLLQLHIEEAHRAGLGVMLLTGLGDGT
jgi:hypothetical protein